MNQIAEAGRPAPVFIVGAPRSGTTMLAAMVGSHKLFGVGPETQFFSKLSPQVLGAAIADPDWPKAATSALMGLMLADQPVADLFETNEAEITACLSQRTPRSRPCWRL